MSRTGLSPADIAEQFRDMCGDGSMEWVCTPMQTWLLLDAADMLDENAKLRELVRHLRECTRHNVCVLCDYADDACDFEYDMRELGVMDDG